MRAYRLAVALPRKTHGMPFSPQTEVVRLQTFREAYRKEVMHPSSGGVLRGEGHQRTEGQAALHRHEGWLSRSLPGLKRWLAGGPERPRVHSSPVARMSHASFAFRFVSGIMLGQLFSPLHLSALRRLYRNPARFLNSPFKRIAQDVRASRNRGSAERRWCAS
jgi:hypothetical protein